MQSFLVALSLLTVIPVRFREAPTPISVARARFAFFIIGILLGLLLGGFAALLAPLDRPMVCAVLVLAAWIGITGALHLDGFCDLCDGLFGGKTPEERLAILKDPHLGTFGLVGGCLLLLGKFVGLATLFQRAPAETPLLLAASVTV